MKKTTLIIEFLLVSMSQSILAQEIELKGQVSIHNSKYDNGEIEYVPNAFASAPFAGSDDTDVEGKFNLTFVGIDGGTTVKVSVEKDDLEVVNDYDLQQVIIGRKSVLRVYLAKKGNLALAQTELFNICKDALFAQKNALIARLQGNKQERDAAIQELETNLGIEIPDVATAIDVLETKMENLEKRLPEFAQKLAAVNLDFASDLYIRAYEHYKKGEIEKAILVLDDAQLEASYKTALTTIEKGQTLENIGQELQDKGLMQVDQIIESYQLKAESYDLLFQYRLAMETRKKIVQIIKEVKGDNSIDLVNAYNALAGSHRDLGKFQKALDAIQKSIAIIEKVYEDNHPSIATSYNNLASIYKDLGDFQKALDAQKKSIAIREKVYEQNHPNIAASYNNMAGIFYYTNKIDSALSYKYKAYNIWKEKLPATHPNLEIVKDDLAFLHEEKGQSYQQKGNYSSAIADFQQALAFTQDSASIYNQIGLCYYYQKDFNKAIQYYEQSHQIDPSNEVVFLNNTGMAYAKLGQFEEAEKSFKQLQQLVPENGLVYRDWAVYYALKGDKTTALSNLEKAVEMGFDSLEKILNEEAFVSLKEEARFRAVVGKLGLKEKE